MTPTNLIVNCYAGKGEKRNRKNGERKTFFPSQNGELQVCIYIPVKISRVRKLQQRILQFLHVSAAWCMKHVSNVYYSAYLESRLYRAENLLKFVDCKQNSIPPVQPEINIVPFKMGNGVP